MAKKFSESEKRILALFESGKVFVLNNVPYTIIAAGKPVCHKGEPKTDIYVKARDKESQKTIEIKISFKQHNADFLENKTNAERAQLLLGENWANIIKESTLSIKDQFLNRPLIYKNKYGNTQKGSITLGWKFELLNKPGGQLSGELELSKEQVLDVYAGTNLPNDKKHAKVNGEQIINSGIATHILFDNAPCGNVQEVMNSLITVEEFADKNPKMYFACKALNYRSFDKKHDGNRPLAVVVMWYIENNKLCQNLCFDNPLLSGGNYAKENLLKALNIIDVETTDDLSEDLINSDVIVKS